MNIVRVVLVLVLAMAAAVAANIVLLGVANGPKDPVGKLSPRAGLVQLNRNPSAKPVERPASVGSKTIPGDDRDARLNADD